jgi:hypothetical protein
MMVWKTIVFIKKYDKIADYVCRGQTPYTVLKHISYRFNINLEELLKAYHKGKIDILWKGIAK